MNFKRIAMLLGLAWLVVGGLVVYTQMQKPAGGEPELPGAEADPDQVPSAEGEASEPEQAQGESRTERREREAEERRLEDERLAAERTAEEERLALQAREAFERFQERARNPDEHQREVIERIFDPVERAAERYGKHDDLDESTWFGEDQESNNKAIDELLDKAIQVLEISGISETRAKLRRNRERIAELENTLARDREARISAPAEEDLTTLEKPFKDSAEDIDARIDTQTLEKSELELEIVVLEQDFVDSLAEIGVEIDRASAKSLLNTVSGDDFVEMCIAFDNIRIVTVQLQDLTEQAGESLDVARRYYGSYVVLVRIMDRIQKEFIRRIEEEQLPKLAKFEELARKNIEQARKNAASGGDPQVAEQNIRSNKLTQEATEFYRRFLIEQAKDVAAQNEALQPKLRDALNTYDTVRLSSQVAELIREGQRNFSALLELEVPDLRGFENEELEAEFQRLTQELIQP